jgi:hypothetical protein
MKIKGIGTIRKEDAMSILTRDGRKAVKAGEITTEELGKLVDAFHECYGAGKNA